MNSYYDTHPLNLATLASRAAIELDRGVQGIDDQYTSVYKLSIISCMFLLLL